MAVPLRVIAFLRIGVVALAPLLVLASSAARAAIFDDGNDRKPITELRNRPAEQLADEEKAILIAANRIGTFSLCKGEIGGNAFHVRYNGRSAIVTNAHLFMTDDGTLAGCTGSMEDGASYMSNLAWIDSGQDEDFVLREVKLSFPPANWEDLRATFPVTAHKAASDHDVAVFYLNEDISDDVMPDGDRRGFLKATDAKDVAGRLYMLGYALDVGNRSTMVYQERCPGGQLEGPLVIGHTCDVVDGSSGSLLAVMEEGELQFRGIQSSGWIKTFGSDKAADADALNHATSAIRLGRVGVLD